MTSDRYEHGAKVLDSLDGAARQRITDSLGDVSPALADQVVSWAFGEMYDRPALPPRDRQLVILGILTSLGGCEPQLGMHLRIALNVGLTPAEITEALLQAAVYCGMPRSLVATSVARQVFAERGLLPVSP
ncbi:carboxymuconolactone decarboxylase family protein [Nonomuraea sp. NPDC000554]|uniref:carboxymuconolactone decarboxylase family protein n=1 Tax=Nonomuraea sp. NPDC000554 TaxID=3154259 RepID=UPI003321461F